jgi:hypothetical protein
MASDIGVWRSYPQLAGLRREERMPVAARAPAVGDARVAGVEEA